MAHRHRLIGLTGTNGSGKGTIAEILRKRGYAYVSLSDVIREELAAAGIPESRDALIAEGNALRRAFGPDILARRIMARIVGPTIVDSIRNPAEVLFLRGQPGFVLWAVDAPPAARFERVARRGRNESAGTAEEFRRKENEEMTNDPAAQQLHNCMALADRVLINDGTVEDLERRLEELL